MDDNHGGTKIHYCGTGFFAAVQSQVSQNKTFLYLVTAKHVVIQMKGGSFYVRANSLDGKSISFKGGDNIKWIYHPTDSTSDVAVYPMAIPQEIFKRLDVRPLSTAIFLTEQERVDQNIGEGDDVFITGLFAHHHGNSKNSPIIRMGNIAMIPEEPIPTTHFGNMEAYLIESRSIGGLSGSPVFALKPVAVGQFRIHLLGLVHGHWDVKPNTLIDIMEDAGAKAGVNVGIAIVAPAEKILETLFCDELSAARKRVEAKIIADNSPTPD